MWSALLLIYFTVRSHFLEKHSRRGSSGAGVRADQGAASRGRGNSAAALGHLPNFSMPVRFEPNVNQADSAAEFVGCGGGTTVLLTRAGIEFAEAGPGGESGRAGRVAMNFLCGDESDLCDGQRKVVGFSVAVQFSAVQRGSRCVRDGDRSDVSGGGIAGAFDAARRDRRGAGKRRGRRCGGEFLCGRDDDRGGFSGGRKHEQRDSVDLRELPADSAAERRISGARRGEQCARTERFVQCS
jgi:hypothetical protein